jgi:hypothetical protein
MNISSRDNRVELYDAATTGAMSSSTAIMSFEAATGTSGSFMFPYPKDLTNGLAVKQGGETRVTIFYERYRA